MEKLKHLFPTSLSVAIFVAYMTFCVGQGILITASKTGSSGYDYSTIAAVLLTEAVKLVIAVFCYLKDSSFKTLVFEVQRDRRMCMLYLVPSFLYCIYNNLAFTNLAAFDPTTYYLLLQLRVVVTGLIFQIVFSRKLSYWQWISLCMLTAGCMLQQLNWDKFTNQIASGTDATTASGTDTGSSFRLSFNLVLILVQTACSCLAGVYNEYLLKGEGGNVNIFVQNIFMYVDSIMWNLVLFAYNGDLLNFSWDAVASLMRPLVLILIVNNALIGITTSLFLKNLNSILKTFASALEIVFTAVLSFLLFGLVIKPNTWMAIVIVSVSVYMYTKNPVVNKAAPASSKELV